LLYGFVALTIYFIGIFFYSEVIPTWRYNRDKKDTIENFNNHESTFEKIRNTGIELPDFDLRLDGDKTLLIFDLNETETLRSDYWDSSFSQALIDTFSNKIKWSILIHQIKNDTIQQECLSLFQKEIFKFENLRKWGKEVECDRILNRASL